MSRSTNSQLIVPSTRRDSQDDSIQRPSRRGSVVGLAWMWACFLLAGGLFWQGMKGTSHEDQAVASVVSVSHDRPVQEAQPQPTKFLTKAIRDIRVGERVLARNPEVSDDERSEAIEPDPATWRHVSLVMQKSDGSDLHIEMLRPAEWLEAHAVAQIDLQTPGWLVREHLLMDETRWEEGLIGRTIDLDLPEMGASGPAKVTAIQPCPTIEPNSGRDRQVVTATFTHSAGEVLDLHIEGEPEPIGTTLNHPFWSEDRQAFVPAGELNPGETLRRADQTLTQLTRITPRRGPPAPVFNLEVNAEHVYFVSNGGVLVHNTYDMHHGTPRQVIKWLDKFYGIPRSAIQGVAGNPNRVRIGSAIHQAAHNGRLGVLPRYNPEFMRRVETLRDYKNTMGWGPISANDIWNIRAGMLFDYFGI